MRFLALPAVLVLGFAVAGCGGGSKAPSVADLGSSAATTTTQSDAAPGGSSQRGATGGSGSGLTMQTKNGAQFAACMRSHGVPNFPDPDSSGGIRFGPGSGIDPNSPKFKAAQQACQKLLPNGGTPTPQQQAKAKQQMLDFSKCMRAHGVKDFPDPTFSGGRIQLGIKSGGAGSDLDPNSPVFKAAQKACRGDLPGKGGALTGGGK